MRGGRGGGRGGRGRFGRGGGGASQDLIRDNLEDLGLDYADVFKKDDPNNTEAGEIYPTVDLVPPPNIQHLPEKQLYLIEGNNIVQTRCKASPFFISAQVEQKEITRYSDSKKRSAPSVSLYDTIMLHFNNQNEDALKYVPAELLDSRLLRGLKPLSSKSAANSSGAGGGKGLDDLNLQKLEQAEKTHDPSATKEEEEEEGGDEEAEEVADDFEMDDDYGVDHYASDNEFGGDNGDMGDGEADF